MTFSDVLQSTQILMFRTIFLPQSTLQYSARHVMLLVESKSVHAPARAGCGQRLSKLLVRLSSISPASVVVCGAYTQRYDTEELVEVDSLSQECGGYIQAMVMLPNSV